MHGLAHRVDGQRLLEDFGRVGRDAGQVLIGHRQVGKELRLGERRRLVGVKLTAKHRSHRIDEAGPLRIERVVGLAAGHNVRAHLARSGIPGQEPLCARLTARSDRRPDVACFRQLLHRVAAEQHVVEHALPEMLIEIGGELGIRNPQGPGRIVEPRAVDHAVL